MRSTLLASAFYSSTALGSVGDYVAAGLGLSSTTSSENALSLPGSSTTLWRNTTTSTQATLSTASTQEASSILGSLVASTASATTAGSLSSTLLISSSHESVHANSLSSILATNSSHATRTGISNAYTNSANLTGNLTTFTAVPTGDCIAQWGQYWLAGPRTSYTTLYSAPETSTYTLTTYDLYETSWLTSVQPAVTEISTWVETALNGDFTELIYTTTETTVQSAQSWYSVSINEASHVSMSTITDTETNTPWWDSTLVRYQAYPKPTCALPAGVNSDCQAEWVTYVSKDPWRNLYTEPTCTQASITGKACSFLVDKYFWSQTFLGRQADLGYSTTNGSLYWPSTQTFAPGCTLGCQGCAIRGETVQLYYWPPATAGTGAAFVNGNGTATVPAGINSLNSSGPVVASVDGVYLTSPTVYVSYDKLYASDSCSGVGKTYYNTIIPLEHPDALSSMGIYTAPGRGTLYSTMSFDYGDLKEPVPDSIYNKQPRCVQSSMIWFIGDTFDDLNGPFTCPRIGAYAPIIAAPAAVSDIDPAWSSCTAWYGGLYDPPKALQPMSAQATVSSAYVVSSMPASPGSTATEPGPTQTTPPPVLTTSAALADASSAGGQASQTPAGPQSTNGVQSSVDTASNTPAGASAPAGDPEASNTAADPSDPTRTSGSADSDPLVSAIEQVAAGTGAVDRISASSADPAISPARGFPATLTVGSNSALMTAVPVDGQSVAFAIAGSTTTLAVGQTGTIAGHTVSAGSSYVQVDASANALLPYTPSFSGFVTHDPIAIVTASNGQIISAYGASGHMILQAGGSAVTLIQGQTTVLAGQTIAVASDGAGAIVDGDRTLMFADSFSSGASTQPVVSDGHRTLTFQQDSTTSGAVAKADFTGTDGHSIVLVDQPDGGLGIFDGTSTILLSAGQIATFDGRTISAGDGASRAVVDGSTLVLTASQSAVSASSTPVMASSQATAINAPTSTTSTENAGSSPMGISRAVIASLMVTWLAMWLGSR